MKTFQPKHSDVSRNWHLIDLSDQILGRVSTKIATFLMGKHKVTYSSHMDMGDYVVAINADKIKLTGNKEKQKVYQSHSGYPKGFKEVKYLALKAQDSRKIIMLAVTRMLPKNGLQSIRTKRLKVFAGNIHKYTDKFNTETK